MQAVQCVKLQFLHVKSLQTNVLNSLYTNKLNFARGVRFLPQKNNGFPSEWIRETVIMLFLFEVEMSVASVRLDDGSDVLRFLTRTELFLLLDLARLCKRDLGQEGTNQFVDQYGK